MRVYHKTFGEGTVISESNGYSTVNFDTCGTKIVATNELSQMIFG